MVRWPQDRGLQARMMLTIILLTVVYLIFIAVLAYIGIDTILLVVIVAVMALAQYFFSDRLVLLTAGAREVSEKEQPRLHETLTRLCAMAGITKPGLAIVNSSVPNAFATGRSPSHSVIAVTTGLVNTLNQEEVEAVMAHELSHVKNRDVMVITLASFLSSAAFIIMRNWLFYGSRTGTFGQTRSTGGGGQKGNTAVLLLVIPLVAAMVWVISSLLVKALSRYREFSADRGSAILTGQPSHLASALMKISGLMARIPTKDLRSVEGMNAFFIVPALSGSSIFELFSTHPSVEQRIAALARIEQELRP